MTRFITMCMGAVLLALMINIGIACAADGDAMTADLNVSKVVSSAGPFKTNDEVTWIVTLWNNGPGNATNITVAEDMSGLTGLQDVRAVASPGDYNTTTNLWHIDELKNATSARLTLVTNFSTSGEKINAVRITDLDQVDPNANNNYAEKNVLINAASPVFDDKPLSVKLSIKPTTLNLKSKGVFTVFVTLNSSTSETSSGNATKPRIDYENSTLTCSGAEMIRASVSEKDGGTLIAKFHRQDLENVTSGQGVIIQCSGSLVVNNKTLKVEGSDTIRVIGEKKGLDKILSGLWKFLGVEKDDIVINETEDGTITVTLSLNPDNFRNPGQIKKILKNLDNESAIIAGNETIPSIETQKGKEHPLKNNRTTTQMNENNASNNGKKGNNDKNERDEDLNGKQTGKNKK